MRNLFGFIVILGLGFSSTARASELSIEFASGDPVNAELEVGQTVTVNVLWTQDADEADDFGLGYYGFSLTAAPQNHSGTTATPDRVENDALFQVDNTPANGFGDGGAMGTVGGLSYVAGGANNPANSINNAVTDLVLGTFEIRADAEGVHEIYIFRNAGLLSPDMAGSAGASLQFSNNPDGYNEFSIGSGFAGRNDGSDAMPLTITVAAATTSGGGGGGGGGIGGGGGGGTDGGGTDDGTDDGGTDDGGSGSDGDGTDGGTDDGTGGDDGNGSDGGGDDGSSGDGSDDGGNGDDGSGQGGDNGAGDDGSGDNGSGNGGSNDDNGDDSGGNTNSGNTGGGFCAVGMTSTTMSILSGLMMMWGVSRKNRYRQRI